MLCVVPPPTNEYSSRPDRWGVGPFSTHAPREGSCDECTDRSSRIPLVSEERAGDPCDSFGGDLQILRGRRKRGKVMVCASHCRASQLPSPQEGVHALCQECVQLSTGYFGGSVLLTVPEIGHPTVDVCWVGVRTLNRCKNVSPRLSSAAASLNFKRRSSARRDRFFSMCAPRVVFASSELKDNSVYRRRGAASSIHWSLAK